MDRVHPGEILIEEMAERNISANDLADALSISTNRINSILHGQCRITVGTARLLARYLGTSQEFWMNLQRAWDRPQSDFSSKNQ